MDWGNITTDAAWVASQEQRAQHAEDVRMIGIHAEQLEQSVIRQLSGSAEVQVATLRELARLLNKTADRWDN